MIEKIFEKIVLYGDEGEGAIIFVLFTIWFGFFLFFFVEYISYIIFNKHCTIGYAIVTGHTSSYDYETGRHFGSIERVRLLDVDDDKAHQCRYYDGEEKNNPPGKKKKVTYRKTMFGYDIRGLEERGQSALKMMFVMQLIPFLFLLGVILLSIF